MAAKASQSALQGAAEVSVMTFNIHSDTLPGRLLDGPNAWPQRRQRVLNALRESNCDVVGLQECVERQLVYLQPILAEEYDSYAVGTKGGLRGELCPLFWKR